MTVREKINCSMCGKSCRYNIDALCRKCRLDKWVKNNPETICRECGRTAHCVTEMLCPECYSEDRRLRSVYGIGLRWKRDTLEKQENMCAVCGVVFSASVRPNIDHDHKTGVVRGILCANCNYGLGNFADSEERLYRAISYLRKSVM